MAPRHAKEPPAPAFEPDERVLCFHMSLLYEAKILDVRPAPADDGGAADAAAPGPSSLSASAAAATNNNSTGNSMGNNKNEQPRWQYKIHYKGWKSTWDD